MERICPITFETLLDHRENRLTEAVSQTVTEHLQTNCPVCRQRLEWFAAHLPLLPEAASLRPLPSLQARTNVLELARLLPSPQPTGWRQYIAQLLPSTQPLAPAGVRGETTDAIQKVYSTEAHLVTLWEEAETSRSHYLIGQVYERNGDLLYPLRVTLLSPRAKDRDAVQEGSEFHLSDVPTGVYALSCRFETTEVLLPDVEVGYL